MSYFSLDVVSKAYEYVAKNTKEKFWGVLSILYSIDGKVQDNVSYTIDTPKLSNFLEDVFRLAEKKTYDNTSSQYSVVFSKKWQDKLYDYIVVTKLEIIPVIIWAYRNRRFSKELSYNELIELFVNDFHLAMDVVEDIFSISTENWILEYTSNKYDDSTLLTILGGNESASTIKMNYQFVVANAGDLSRGPYFQPLYAALQTLECLILFPFDEREYYNLSSNSQSNKHPHRQILHSIPAPDNNLPYLTALRTKPFLLLAGISGTGKSQKVQELAFMTCPEGELREEGGTTPGNYCLIEVKPNWHDSTELLGYYSALSGKYELTDFIRFVYKASQNENVPFFLCLDEMNLAPVEQYLAEYLSVLETRKIVNGEIQAQYLLTKDRFSNCELSKKIPLKQNGFILDEEQQYEEQPLYSEKDKEIISYLKANGLSIPANLFVIGTVNMDDTTHQFSRKVIDRAFTIEMNGGKMSEMFTPESKALLEYREEPVPLEVFKPQFIHANEVFDDARFAKYKDVVSKRIPKLLGDSDGNAEEDSINGVLNQTPFRVSYRVQNELVLYLSTLIERAGFPDDIEGLIGEATLAILLEKVLPRIQGEQKQLETKNGSNILKDLMAFVDKHFKPEENVDENVLYTQVIKKLEEMDRRLTTYYTNFF